MTLCLCGQTYHIGDLYTAPDGSRGIVYFVLPDGSGGWAVALNDASTGCKWGESLDIPEIPNLMYGIFTYQQANYDTAGYQKTALIRAFQNNSQTYAAGKVDFENGWYLPSPGQLSLLCAQRPFISAAIVNAGGTLMANQWYWTSSESDYQNACAVHFGNPDSHGIGDYRFNQNKSVNCRVRAVRSFSYGDEPVPVTYLWNTGDTTPDITVTLDQTITYSVTVTTPGGCADTVEHTIVVNNAEPQTFYDEVCQGEPYYGYGFDVTMAETSEPGSLVRTRTEEQYGCTVTHTLELTVMPAPHTDIEMFACDEYQWNDQTYTSSGDYTVSYPKQVGCDSVVKLHLTISYTPDANVMSNRDSICWGDEVSLQAEIENMSAFLVTQPLSLVTVGDILCTDNSIVKASDWPMEGKIARGVVFYVDDTGEHGWAVHLRNQSSSIRWTAEGNNVDISELDNFSDSRAAITDFEGYMNTLKIRAAGNSTMYPAAWLVDLDNGWYLPAAGQLRLLYAMLPTVNASLMEVGGGQIVWNRYWSSTEYANSSPWNVLQAGGVGHHNGYLSGVRSVCNF